MKVDDKIRDEKLQYDINRKAAKNSALSTARIDKYENFTSEELLTFNQSQVIEPAKFTCSPLGKSFDKLTKSIEGQGEKQIKTIEDHGKQLAETSVLV